MCIGFTFHTPQNVSECIGMYRDVSALLFIAPRMTRYIPIHSDTFIFNQEKTIKILCLDV